MEENKTAEVVAPEVKEEVQAYNGFALGKHKGHGLAYHHAQKKKNREKEKSRRASVRAQRKNKRKAKRQKRRKFVKR